MGSLLSLPLLSFLAVPFYSSPGTSINLLLFTVNWYILLLTHPPLQVELYGIALVRILFYLLPGLLFLAFDTLLPTVAVQLKAQGNLGLPTRQNKNRQAHILFWSLFNAALGVALHFGIETLATRGLRLRSALSLSKTMPLPYDMVKAVLSLLAIRGISQYAIHRFLLHGPRSPLTRLHLGWQHSVPAPYSLISSYDHPLCYVLHSWAPLYVPAYALRTHLLPFLLALSLTSLEETLTYCGYSAALLPSAIMLPGMARRLDRHFLAAGEGNFAPWGVADWVLGTSVGADVGDDLKEEWEGRGGNEKVKEVGGRVKGAADRVGRGARRKGVKAR